MRGPSRWVGASLANPELAAAGGGVPSLPYGRKRHRSED